MSERQPLVLHVDTAWVSPYAYSCFVVLHEKELLFEVRLLDIDHGAQNDPVFRDRSLTARIPALVHGDFWLSESLAIVDYLEEAFPAPAFPALLPENIRERARARQICGWIRSDFLALRDERSTDTMFHARSDKPLSPAARKAADKVLRVAEAVVPEGRGTIFGEFSVADADLAFLLMRLVLNGDEVPVRLRAYAEAIWQRASVRSYVVRERPPLAG